MFGQDSKIQLAVLQERFKSHEQIIEKVDSAIQTLSETNSNICRMLAVHDEKITTHSKTEDEICKKVDDIELKVDGLYKFRWQIGGVIAFVVVLIGFIPTVVPILTEKSQSTTIERAK